MPLGGNGEGYGVGSRDFSQDAKWVLYPTRRKIEVWMQADTKKSTL